MRTTTVNASMAATVIFFVQACAPASCPMPSGPGASPSHDGWCVAESSNTCPPSSPHAYVLCGDGQGAKPYPSACAPDVIITNPDGAVCCP